MDSEPGPSRPRQQQTCVVDSDNEKLYFEDDFEEYSDFSDEVESSSLSEDENIWPVPSLNFSSLDFSRHRATQSTSNQPSASPWCTIGNVHNLIFTKNNFFLGQRAGTSPIDYFNFFFETEFLQMICVETNAQAERLFLNNRPKFASMIINWRTLTVGELKIFLGLLFHMGSIPLNRIQDYWNMHHLFSIPIFTKKMLPNRFLGIMRCLHFTSDTEGDAVNNKGRHVLDYFNKKMEDCYYPGKELILDESMVLCGDRMICRRYVKNKRYKHGIRLYMLAESNGIVLRFYLHTGSKNDKVDGEGHATEVVFNLLKNYLYSGHSLYMDKFYNSYQLTRKLLKKYTYCTGMLSKNLKQNPTIARAKIQKGENVSYFREGVHVGKWKDKYSELYISSEYPNRMVSVTNTRNQIKEKPEAIAKYNEFMTSIDHQELIFSYYPCKRMKLHWYAKIAIHTFHLLLLNTYKIYNKFSGQPRMSLHEYRLSIINLLLFETAHNIAVQNRNNTNVFHRIGLITERLENGPLRRKYCCQCSKYKKLTETMWHCPACPQEPGLCVDCFNSYHSYI
ncbi:piggyBac transposable element-derived protein 4-like [Galleria mellonella]|uniref:PiggyBac transposable element-derived protein 4-like n=1 Tax=Galleria mellonella TaxID=7137 RepID=A0ABM3MY98_GALME|nr:piggyBac transposable element-derived protein 4-like [Galleria mellonella]